MTKLQGPSSLCCPTSSSPLNASRSASHSNAAICIFGSVWCWCSSHLLIDRYRSFEVTAARRHAADESLMRLETLFVSWYNAAEPPSETAEMGHGKKKKNIISACSLLLCSLGCQSSNNRWQRLNTHINHLMYSAFNTHPDRHHYTPLRPL